jgi:aryl carrier-like protein
LRHEPIDVHDNFFAIGGHSIVAMRIAHRLRRTFGVPVDYVMLLERPTVAALAEGLRDSGYVTPEVDRAGREYLLMHGLPVPDPS